MTGLSGLLQAGFKLLQHIYVSSTLGLYGQNLNAAHQLGWVDEDKALRHQQLHALQQ